MPYPVLDETNPEFFPDPLEADAEGFIGFSKSLSSRRLISAYQQGIFPWMKLDEAPFYWRWFSPDPRMCLYPAELDRKSVV